MIEYPLEVAQAMGEERRKLRADCDRYRAALEQIAKWPYGASKCAQIAAAALDEKE